MDFDHLSRPPKLYEKRKALEALRRPRPEPLGDSYKAPAKHFDAMTTTFPHRDRCNNASVRRSNISMGSIHDYRLYD